MFFFALQVSFQQIFCAFEKKPDKLVWARLKEKSFGFVAKWLEHLESRKILCVSVDPGYKILTESIRCFYNNVIDRLYVAACQSMIDRREQMLRLDTSQLALIRVPIVH